MGHFTLAMGKKWGIFGAFFKPKPMIINENM